MVGVYGNIVDPEFEKDVRIVQEAFMEAMLSYNLRLTPKEHVPEYVYRPRVRLEPNTGESVDTFRYVLSQIESDLYKLPDLLKTLT